MKKLLVTFAILSAVTPMLASANTLFDSLTTDAERQAFSAQNSGGNPLLVMQVWGLTGQQTPLVDCDEFGFKTKCVDISKTSYYLSHLVR